jgi:hypothetical protein
MLPCGAESALLSMGNLCHENRQKRKEWRAGFSKTWCPCTSEALSKCGMWFCLKRII